jgi:hypothetical protein
VINPQLNFGLFHTINLSGIDVGDGAEVTDFLTVCVSGDDAEAIVHINGAQQGGTLDVSAVNAPGRVEAFTLRAGGRQVYGVGGADQTPGGLAPDGSMHVDFVADTPTDSTTQYALGRAATTDPDQPAVITATNHTSAPLIISAVNDAVQAKLRSGGPQSASGGPTASRPHPGCRSTGQATPYSSRYPNRLAASRRR